MWDIVAAAWEGHTSTSLNYEFSQLSINEYVTLIAFIFLIQQKKNIYYVTFLYILSRYPFIHQIAQSCVKHLWLIEKLIRIRKSFSIFTIVLYNIEDLLIIYHYYWYSHLYTCVTWHKKLIYSIKNAKKKINKQWQAWEWINRFFKLEKLVKLKYLLNK